MLHSNTDILNSLSQKLQHANRTVIQEKKKQREQIEDRVQRLQKRLMEKKKHEIQSLQKTKVSVQNIQRLTLETIKDFKIKARKEEELVRTLKEQIENDLEFEAREHQQKIQQIIERQTEIMTDRIQATSKKSKILSEKNEKLLNQLSKTLTKLQKDINEESQTRIQSCKRVKADIGDQISKFYTVLQREQERRQASEAKLRLMMEQIEEKIGEDVQGQADKRMKNNELILKLIQSACQKLQTKIQS